MTDLPGPVESSVRIYRLLVKAYPASFRGQYENEMTRVFHELATDAFRRQGAVGLGLTWFRVLGDLVATALIEHLAELNRRPDMKATAFTILSVLAAAFVNLYVFAVVGMTIGLPLSMISQSTTMKLVLFYLPVFFTGMIIARVKPFYKPRLTAPVGAMALASIGVLQEAGTPWWVRIGVVASMGLVSLVGCIGATRIPARLKRLSVPLPCLAGTLAVLVCTSSVGCVLWLLLAGNQLGQSMRATLIACLLALGLIAALATANLIHFAVRQSERAELN